MLPGYDRPRLQVLVGDRDVTERCDAITFSATDAGGFEIATLGLPSTDRPKKGTMVTLRQGLEVAWQGRVTEIADHSQHGHATKTTGCEGYRALLRDSPFSMIYIDRDLGRWQNWSLSREIAVALSGVNVSTFSWTTNVDAANGLPGIVIQGQGPLSTSPEQEVWYDAGPNNLIARARFDSGTALGYGFPDAAVVLRFVSASSDNNANSTADTNIAAATVSRDWVLPTQRRYIWIQHVHTGAGPSGAAGTSYGFSLSNLTMIGNHGLTLRGTSPGDGFYPSDIAQHALSQVSGVVSGKIIDASAFIVPHAAYRTATSVDTIIDDMAKLMGWTWGVWEPPTILNSQPRLDFGPPPTNATAVVSKAECDQLDITSRLGDLYNVAQVSYTDPARGLGIATVTLNNPQLNEAGIADRTLILDMGVGTLGSATLFGQFALALAQAGARAAGQATLPVSVRLPGGGSKPACLLRPGIDRLRITDLVDAGPLLDIGNVRRDVFRISRAETSVAVDGSLSTRLELDNGPNLLEVLQARLGTETGQGASGG